MTIFTKYISRPFYGLLILVISCSCSAQNNSSPDQLIMGPFNVTTEWQTIPLAKPLLTVPFVQTMDVLVDMDDHILVDTTELDTKYSITNQRLKRESDGQITASTIILIDSNGKELKLTRRGSGIADTEKGLFRYLGHGTNSKAGKFLYPKDIKLTSIKIRANTPMKIEGFRWRVSRYYTSDKSWDDVNQSEIMTVN